MRRDGFARLRGGEYSGPWAGNPESTVGRIPLRFISIMRRGVGKAIVDIHYFEDE